VGASAAAAPLLLFVRRDTLVVMRRGRSRATAFGLVASVWEVEVRRPEWTTSRSAARDRCSLTKGAVSGSTLDSPLTCELDEQLPSVTSGARLALLARSDRELTVADPGRSGL
jgi:hypothetical protein